MASSGFQFGPRLLSLWIPMGWNVKEYIMTFLILSFLSYSGYADVSGSNGGGEPLVVDADKLMKGSLYKGIAKSGSQSYLANLSLYPGKSELPFLPSNTQAVILQPLGNKGIAIIGGDMIR